MPSSPITLAMLASASENSDVAEAVCRDFAEAFPGVSVKSAIRHAEAGVLPWTKIAGLFERALRDVLLEMMVDETKPATESRYLTVLTKSPESVRSYLYGHSSVVTTGSGPLGHVLLVKVSAADNVGYLANYQADRLSSGLHGARVHETLEDAEQRMADLLS